MMMVSTVVLVAQVTVAQQTVGAPGGAGTSNQEIAAKLEQISSTLKLTPQQKQQIAPIVKQEVPQLHAVQNNTSLSPMQKAMRLKQIISTTDDQVMSTLNREQQQKWAVIRAQERQEMIQKLENH